MKVSLGAVFVCIVVVVAVVVVVVVVVVCVCLCVCVCVCVCMCVCVTRIIENVQFSVTVAECYQTWANHLKPLFQKINSENEISGEDSWMP